MSGNAPDYDIRREAEDVVAIAESIGEPVTVFGHSYGGLTSSVERLILYEPALPTGEPVFEADAVERMQVLIDRGKLEEAMEVFLRELVMIPDHELEAYRRTDLWEARIPTIRTVPRELETDRTYTFRPERFSGLTTPTLLLLGADSPSLYRSAIEILDAVLPESEVEVVSGQQHMAHHRAPEEVAEAVRRFVERRGLSFDK